MENMKVIVKWEGSQFWMNPDNLVMALRIACPNTKFECEYIIHPHEEAQIKEKIRETYGRGFLWRAILLNRIRRINKKRRKNKC